MHKKADPGNDRGLLLFMLLFIMETILMEM